MSPKTFTQTGLSGDVVVPIRPWRPGELAGQSVRLPKMACLVRLRKAQERIRLGVEAAGSVEAYYDSGGMAGPYGHVKTTQPKAARPKAAPLPTNVVDVVPIDEAAKALRRAQTKLYAAQAAYREAARAAGIADPRIARDAGPQWFAQMYRHMRKETA